LDTPRGPANQGGDVAAPLFAKITTEAVRLLAIPPDDPTRNLRLVTYSPETVPPATLAAARSAKAGPPPIDDPRIMPDLRGFSLREAALLAARHGLSVEMRGSGVVASQAPLPGTPIEPGMSCSLELRSSLPRAAPATEAGAPQALTGARPGP
jgi:hypothetical protein